MSIERLRGGRIRRRICEHTSNGSSEAGNFIESNGELAAIPASLVPFNRQNSPFGHLDAPWLDLFN